MNETHTRKKKSRRIGRQNAWSIDDDVVWWCYIFPLFSYLFKNIYILESSNECISVVYYEELVIQWIEQQLIDGCHNGAIPLMEIMYGLMSTCYFFFLFITRNAILRNMHEEK